MDYPEQKIKLETKKVGSIAGVFHIPSYQRGYRWGKDEVLRLLDDIYTNGDKDYSLQPIVVRRNSDYYELIDGQQRLTTLYLIYKYLHQATQGMFFEEPKFSLDYKTRLSTKEFLHDIDLEKKDENIDFWFLSNAYDTIGKWFDAHESRTAWSKLNEYLYDHVKVIWYEVDETQDSIALFTRLNIGKIPLTSAELVKAMFLSKSHSSDMTQERQEEISLQWDHIEKTLHDDSLWYFLTNQSNSKYQTRIDLILNLISGKSSDHKEKYYTFYYFDGLRANNDLINIWREIQHTFLILKDWYENHELYHKIGYLIASETKSLDEIYRLSQKEIDGIRLTKSEFKKELDVLIKKSVALNKNYSELSYQNTTESKQISKLLLLFNVESVRQNGDQTQWFPFEKIKFHHNGKVVWSLEHIHAQQSEGMRTQSEWHEWLRLHLPSITAITDNESELINEMTAAINNESLGREEFISIQAKVFNHLSPKGNMEYLHSLSNLALLNTSDNAALSNSTFDVKRNSIIAMDKEGKYIPFCTKMVFLKYYTPSDSNQLHFWGHHDRIAYIESINRTLINYLSEPISQEQE